MQIMDETHHKEKKFNETFQEYPIHVILKDFKK
jgi:hypothetical protein